MSNLVLVYGTLKRFPEHRNYKKYLSTSEYLSDAITAQSYYTMLEFNSASSPNNFSPGVLFGHSGLPTGHIMGELYSVSNETLNELDTLEGIYGDNPNYNRKLIQLKNGKMVHMYLKIHSNGRLQSNRIVKMNGKTVKWLDPLLT
jgi:gamma-glutamylcyclotransferase (GGCT)/AIG2-like uncharacterized protein YtfP